MSQPDDDAAKKLARLNPAQREVLELLALGMSTSSIAARLNVTYEAARYLIQEMLTRLEAHSKLVAVTILLRGRPDGGPDSVA